MLTQPEERDKLKKSRSKERLDEFHGIDMLLYIHDPFFFDLDTQVFKHHFASHITKGASFGELGVMRNVQRAATVISTKRTLLGVLEAEDFVKILKPEH